VDQQAHRPIGGASAISRLTCLIKVDRLRYALGYGASAWVLGRSLLRPPSAWVVAFLVGWAILRMVALVPILGGLIWFAAVVFGLGALVVAIWRGRSAARAGPTTA
jgi:hypothetical protein